MAKHFTKYQNYPKRLKLAEAPKMPNLFFEPSCPVALAAARRRGSEQNGKDNIQKFRNCADLPLGGGCSEILRLRLS